MALPKTKGEWTYGDLFKLRDNKHYEIIDGELYEMPSPLWKHVRCVMNLIRILMPEADKIEAILSTAPQGVFFPGADPVEPDIALLMPDQRELISERGIEGAPALILEVLSPGNAKHDLVTKRNLYARAGVVEYWLVSPETETIDVLVLEGNEYRTYVHAANEETVSSKVLSGLSFPASAVFS